MTFGNTADIITNVAEREKQKRKADRQKLRRFREYRDLNSHTERYRSGHNEAVLKTVCPKGRVGSNPTLSVTKEKTDRWIRHLEKYPSG